MYSQNHTANNVHGLMNGAGHRQFNNPLNNLNKQYPHHNPQHHTQHGQAAQDGQHGTYQGNHINHQHNQSGGAGGHFSAQFLQSGAQNNGHTNTTQPTSEYWKKQQEIAEQVRSLQHAHPHARNASSASKAQHPGSSSGGVRDGDKPEVRYRTNGDWSDDEAEASIWTEIDMGGSNLRCISPQLFDYYPFLTKLFLNNNRLQVIPSEVGQLRNLVHLDLSMNSISVLPPEMGMLVNLKALLLVDNQIDVIPYELGNLFALDMLAIDGNANLNEAQKQIIAKDGPQALIKELRETAPGLYSF
jgi:CCR4-NOT transcription complex subunit 6